jgi:putative FmdB family regulatory protein
VPTYDYQCRSCGVVTEVIHPMSEDGPTVCERCGGALRRVLFPAGIIFKGSGFYRNDSRATPSGESGSATKADPAPSSASTGGSDTASSTSTTKSETKSDGAA